MRSLRSETDAYPRMSANERVTWIDAARGIGIVLVVAGHAERGLVSAGIVQGQVWSWIDYTLYTFHMPLFFLLAGLNVPKSLAKGMWIFLQSKLWSVAYPYVLWSVLQGSLMLALSPVTNNQVGVQDILTIGWAPKWQFWFLYVLMACHLASLALGRCPRLLAVAATVSYAASMRLTEEHIVQQFLHHFPFFAVGILLSNRVSSPLPGSDRLRVTFAAVCFVVVVSLSGWWDGLSYSSLAALPATVCGMALVIVVSHSLSGSALRTAILVGQMTMTIFVLHIIASSGVRIVLVKLGVPFSPWVYFLVCTATGIVAPMLVHLILERLGLLPMLGLAAPRRGHVYFPSTPPAGVD